MSKEIGTNTDKNASVESVDGFISNKPSVYHNNNLCRKRLEEKWSMEMIKAENLAELGFPDLKEWLQEISRYGNTDNTCLIFFNKTNKKGFGLVTPSEMQKSVVVQFFTNNWEYIIRANNKILNYDKDRPELFSSYLGCTASERKAKVGENWVRGRDLRDGKYSKETWNKIVCDIVSNEIKNLQCWQ